MEIGVSNWETSISDHEQWRHLTACVESFESNRVKRAWRKGGGPLLTMYVPGPAMFFTHSERDGIN